MRTVCLRFGLAAALLGGLSAGVVQTNPRRVAREARVDVFAASAVGGLDDGAVLLGGGTVGRQTWRPTAEQPRSYIFQVPIVQFAWHEFTLQFVPQRSGTVELVLRGPWEEVTPGTGVIYRQEVLWDAWQATGTALSNPGFETVSGATIVGWNGGAWQAGTSVVPAVDGLRLARCWHDGPISRTLTVTASKPVVLRFHARSYVPPGTPQMRRLSGDQTPAHQAALKFMRGANLGNYLEAPPNTWGTIVYTSADFALARGEGFDHVRLPVGWHHYTGPGPAFTLSNSIFAKVDFLVTNALSHGLGALINIHHFDDLTADPPAQTNKFNAIWRQIAAHYSNAPPTVAFELLNEPYGAATTAVMNPIYAEAIRQIRLTNPGRTIFVGPGLWNSISELEELLLPDDDANLIVTLHSYEPMLFTHQGAGWVGTDFATTNLVFPGPPVVPLRPAPGVAAWVTNWLADYNTLPTGRNPCGPLAFRVRLALAREWSDYYGRPVHLGEFGAYELAPPAARASFYAAMRSALDELGIGWAIWDWKAGFHYIRNGRPDPPEMRAALFPPLRLRATGAGRLEGDAARGKFLVLERAWRLGAAVPWAPVLTQLLNAPHFAFADADSGGRPHGFYRVRWDPGAGP